MKYDVQVRNGGNDDDDVLCVVVDAKTKVTGSGGFVKRCRNLETSPIVD